MESELERTKKMMRSQNGGVASIRDQWSKKGAGSEGNDAPKSNGRSRPIDINISVNAGGSGSVRDRWKKMAEAKESEPAAPLEKPRRKMQDSNFQSVLKRMQNTDDAAGRFNSNPSLDKPVKEGRTPDKIVIDPFSSGVFEEVKIDKEKMMKELEEDEKRKEERKKEREALLKKIEDKEKIRQIEQEEIRKRLEADKQRREMAQKKREEDAKNFAVNGEPKKNFVIQKKSHNQVSNILKAKEENNKTNAELLTERKAVLGKRIKPLEIDDLSYDELMEKAKELHTAIYNLESEKIDLEKCMERQEYDIMELKERANQMQVSSTPAAKPAPLPLKTGGLGVGKLSERFSTNAPPKVQVSNPHQSDPFTRLNDGKSFTDKFKMFEMMAKK